MYFRDVVKPRDLHVRRAVRADLDRIAGIWRASALEMNGVPREVPSRKALRKRIATELSMRWDLRVAIVGDRVVGFLAIKPFERVVDQIFVSPAEQRRGVGTALIDEAKRALPNGFTLRMDAANERARRFYERSDLKLVEEGIHRSTGIDVRIYGWNVG